MTTDPTPLQEQIARSLALTDDYDGCFERLDGTDPEGPLSTDEEDAEWWRKRAAAVLPILRAAQADALRDAAENFRHCEDYPYRATRIYATENYLTARATTIEQED